MSIFFILAITLNSAGFSCLQNSNPQDPLMVSYIIPLTQKKQIPLKCIANKEIPIDNSSRILLTPQQIAAIGNDRIISIKTDTILDPAGEMICNSRCEVDTFFITKDMFLLNQIVEVIYNANGTYSDNSVFGWKVLEKIGSCSGPKNEVNGQPSLTIFQCSPKNLTIGYKLNHLRGIQFKSFPDNPFAVQKFDEIRLINCTNDPSGQIMLQTLAQLFNNSINFSKSVSIEDKMPPQRAIDRLNKGLTIRFFEDSFSSAALFIGECLSFIFSLDPRTIYLEDMRPYYGGDVPLKNYSEIWINN